MFEYVCKDCEVSEIQCKVIPKKECPCCKVMMEVIEWEGTE